MIVYYLCRLPALLGKLEEKLEQSFFFAFLARLYGWLNQSVRQSFFGSRLIRSATEGKAMEGSRIMAWLDRLFAGIAGLIRKVCGFLTAGSYDSAFIHLCRSLLAKIPGADYVGLCGVTCFVMFVCPGQLWRNPVGLGLSVLLFAVGVVRSALRGEAFVKMRIVGLPLAVFTLCVISGILVGANRGESIRIAMFFATAILLCITLSAALEDAAALRRFLGFVYAAVVITGAYGIVQRIMGVSVDASLTDLSNNAGMPGRVFSTFENPNNYAEFLVLSLPMALVWCMGLRCPARHKVLAFGGLTLPLVSLLMTYSRSGWVGFALAALVCLFLWKKRLIPALVILGFMLIPLLPQTIVNRIMTIGSSKDSSNMYRLYIWDAVMRMLPTYGITGLGLGPGNFQPIYLTYTTSYAMHAHMLYLEIWLEMGIIGVTAMLGWYLGAIRRSIAWIKGASETVRLTLIAGTGSLCGMAFIASVEYIWFYPRVMFTFFMVVGVLTAAAAISRRENKA